MAPRPRPPSVILGLVAAVFSYLKSELLAEPSSPVAASLPGFRYLLPTPPFRTRGGQGLPLLLTSGSFITPGRSLQPCPCLWTQSVCLSLRGPFECVVSTLLEVATSARCFLVVAPTHPLRASWATY